MNRTYGTIGTIGTTKLRGYVRQLEKAGCIPVWDEDARTVVVRDGQIVVLRAFQHPSGRWIARFLKSERINWS